MLPNNIPLSLYIHTPWCIKKCPYCDFNSHKLQDDSNESTYIDALILDMQEEAPRTNKRPIHSIFIGGGTPSLLSAKAYARLFDALHTHFNIPKNIEITMEANPGSVEATRFKDYNTLGINRLSLGIQSFQDEQLKALGRVHNASDAIKAIEIAKQAGFENFNIDIMHGLPGQTPKMAADDLNLALSFSPSHLSWYQLTIEPNTLFYKKTPELPTEDILAEIEYTGLSILSHMTHYEISAFCQDNKQSQHNLNYWLFGDYIGLGAGAAGKLTQDKGIFRRQKKKQPTNYQKSPSFAHETHISKESALFEFMLNTTRLKTPIPFTLFTARTGQCEKVLQQALKTPRKQGLIEHNEIEFWVTPMGFKFLNDLQAMFLEY